MFASNTSPIIDIDEHKKAEVLPILLQIHKKIKTIAKHESISKSKYKVAKINPEELNQIKSLESKLGYCLIACEHKAENKTRILSKVNFLLDEYLELYKSKETEDDFSKFFEQ